MNNSKKLCFQWIISQIRSKVTDYTGNRQTSQYYLTNLGYQKNNTELFLLTERPFLAVLHNFVKFAVK